METMMGVVVSGLSQGAIFQYPMVLVGESLRECALREDEGVFMLEKREGSHFAAYGPRGCSESRFVTRIGQTVRHFQQG